MMKKNKTSSPAKSGARKNFEEYYFEGYYSRIGDFSPKRDRELSNWFRAVFEYVNRYYPIKHGRGKKLIEFGCATGAAANLLADYGFNVYSTDISSYAVRLAKKHYPDIKFSLQDMQKLFTLDSDFDIVVAFDVVEHLKEPKIALMNAYKILKPGGTIILTTPNDYKHMSNDPTHINVKKPAVWRKIIKQIGFKDIVIKQVTFVPYLYRFHWRLNYALPIAVSSQSVISPVVIIARRGQSSSGAAP